jgi:hypothetical protein
MRAAADALRALRRTVSGSTLVTRLAEIRQASGATPASSSVGCIRYGFVRRTYNIPDSIVVY